MKRSKKEARTLIHHDDLITVAEALKILKVSRSHFYELKVKHQALESVASHGQRLMYDRKAVERLSSEGWTC